MDCNFQSSFLHINVKKQFIPVLDAIFTWYNEEYEVNVVMDGPDPDLEELIRTYAVNLYILDSQKGPAFARNFGARKSKRGISPIS